MIPKHFDLKRKSFFKFRLDFRVVAGNKYHTCPVRDTLKFSNTSQHLKTDLSLLNLSYYMYQKSLNVLSVINYFFKLFYDLSVAYGTNLNFFLSRRRQNLKNSKILRKNTALTKSFTLIGESRLDCFLKSQSV